VIHIDPYNPKTPLIGICVSNGKRAFQRLVQKRIQRYPGDVSLIRFHIEDLNFEHLQVKGDCLEKKEGKINRKQGIFPFPDVIYMQCHVDREILKKIEQMIGRKVFNSFLYDKWQGWDLLAKDNVLRHYLPNTRKMESETDLQPFLYNYEDVFLKPIYGHSSKGIIRVELQKEGNIEAFYQKNWNMISKRFKSYQDFGNWISTKLKRKTYIIQQSIQTILWEGKATDIRLNMSKNSRGEWGVSALLFRISSNNSHINRGIKEIWDMRSVTSEALPISNISVIERDIVDLGFKICRTLDESGYHFADIGIDLGVDENGHSWIFEVNPLPYPYDSPFQDHSWTRPLEYAIAISRLPK
jgi:hypothetical protein